MSEGHALLLAFDRDGEDFRDGFEMGVVWTRAMNEDDEFEHTVHAVNAEMLLRIAEATNRAATWEELADGWCEVRFTKKDVT